MVFGFLKNLSSDMSTAVRLAGVTLKIEKVTGRKLSDRERGVIHTFFIAGEYSKKWSDSDIAMDYFCFAATKANISFEQKKGLATCIINAKLNGTLSISDAALNEYYIKAGIGETGEDLSLK